jgi:hypothetical protein
MDKSSEGAEPKNVTMADIVLAQRSEKRASYDRFMKSYRDAMQDPATRKERDASYGLQVRGVSPSSVHSDTFLSNMSVMYANDAYIGERLVTAVPVTKRTDKFAIYPKRERFEYPSDLLGERAHANEISESRSSDTYSLLDYGFQNFLSQDTLDNQDPAFDERVDLIESLNEGMAFKREIRIATALTTASNYDSSTTLSGSNQWDSSTGGNPIKDIQTGIASLFHGPGATDIVGFCSLEVFNVLSRHPHLLDVQKYTTNGLLNRAQIANYLGLSDLLVGAARKQTANEGQTASYSRIWGLDFGIVRVARRASKRTAAFASLFRSSDDPATTEWFDASAGKKGGHYAKVAVSEDLKIVASSAGYIIKAATSA